MIRQFCCSCGRTTDDYKTLTVDQRTDAEVRAGKAPTLRRFHFCLAPACQKRYEEEAA